MSDKTIFGVGSTRIIKCDCIHSFQDRMYGKGKRVHNRMLNPTRWRCIVCSDVKTDFSGEENK